MKYATHFFFFYNCYTYFFCHRFPTKTGLEDEYSRIVQADYETCDHKLKNACPFNVLSWLMGQKQG